MEYRKVDAVSVGEEVLKQRALEDDKQAYMHEIDAKRLMKLEEKVSEEQKTSVIEARERTEEEVVKSAKKAAVSKAASNVQNNDIRIARRSFLDEYIVSLEKEHAGHTALLNSKITEKEQEQDEEDKKRLTQEIKEHEMALMAIESAHEVAVQELDKLTPKAAEKAEQTVKKAAPQS